VTIDAPDRGDAGLDYPAGTTAWDEMVDASGAVRPSWTFLAGVLGRMSPEELGRRRREAAHLLREEGVTYNVHGDPDGLDQPWQLDPVPLLLDSADWAILERGVAQRATLLAAVLRDLYGPRTLIHRGLVAPEIVFAHPDFIRAVDGVQGPVGRELLLTGTDLVRRADGTWAALTDRTQAPSGAGYALENRTVVSRVLPGALRDAGVHRLAPFFRALRTALQTAAPAGVAEPRVVILTPGRFNESFFEHAYLASSLGYSLVEGNDLVVRDGRVWLRSVGGLQQVDVVLRRVDGSWCDPLELRSDSQLGTPGLVECTRRGTVSVVNHLGAGVLENPALLALMPRLCRELLAEDLLLDSPRTWWCGDPVQRSHVVAHLDTLLVKPIFRGHGRTVDTSRLGTPVLEHLRNRIEADPHLWVGIEPVSFASAPTLTAEHLEPRPTMLRTFSVATDDGYLVMTGGLTRVAPAPGATTVASRTGGLTKDTWVLTSEPEVHVSHWLRDGPTEGLAPESTLPARAAEQLFWIGRYAERAEQIVRLARAVISRRNEFADGIDPEGVSCVETLLVALTHLTATYPGFVGAGPDPVGIDTETELRSVLGDGDRAGSLAANLESLLVAASAVRDQLSADTWLVVSNLHHEIDALHVLPTGRSRITDGVLSGVLKGLLALSGLATESMIRDPGWHFLDAGRRLERAMGLTTLLRATVVPVRSAVAESLLLESVLITAESIITYRRRYRSHAHVATLLDLLLLDPTNPRSVGYQLEHLAGDLQEVPRADRTRLGPDQRLVLEATTRVSLADTEHLAGLDERAVRWDLDRLLSGLADLLDQIGLSIDPVHFAPVQPPRGFGEREVGAGGTIDLDEDDLATVWW
jgi:uncharacterized circularly permuted ATP-grasp superfamily protein/uncharacterized alpha-E superfamily protein